MVLQALFFAWYIFVMLGPAELHLTAQPEGSDIFSTAIICQGLDVVGRSIHTELPRCKVELNEVGVSCLVTLLLCWCNMLLCYFVVLHEVVQVKERLRLGCPGAGADARTLPSPDDLGEANSPESGLGRFDLPCWICAEP